MGFEFNCIAVELSGSSVADFILGFVHMCRDSFLLQVTEHNLNYFKGNETLLAHITVR